MGSSLMAGGRDGTGCIVVESPLVAHSLILEKLPCWHWTVEPEAFD